MFYVIQGLKIAISAVVAVFVSNLLGLDYAIAAGIIAILSIMDTKSQSMEVVFQRMLSAFLALAIGAIVFYFFGFSLWTFGIYLAIYAPLAYLTGLSVGLGPCSVLVSHLLAEQDISLAMLINEVLLMLIGGMSALLFNLYMPSRESKLLEIQDYTSQQVCAIFNHFEKVVKGDAWLEEVDLQIEKLEELIKRGVVEATKERENQLLNGEEETIDEYSFAYFEMREKQLRVMRKIRQLLDRVDLPLEEQEVMASLFNVASENTKNYTQVHDMKGYLDQLFLSYRKSPLPKNQDDLEKRANLYVLLVYMDEFIDAMKDFAVQNRDYIVEYTELPPTEVEKYLLDM